MWFSDVEEVKYYEAGKDFFADPENQWVKQCLEMNRCYEGWGVGKEAMWTSDDVWNASLEWTQFSELFPLDDFHELVNVYFFVEFPDVYDREDPKPYDPNLPIRLGVQLWYLHPEKGCSRGAVLLGIQKHEVNPVINYLKTAQKRNRQRFSKLHLLP